MESPIFVDAWSNKRRVEYLNSVIRRLGGIKLLHDAAMVGKLADPYAVADSVALANQELHAVIDSLSEPN